MQLASSCGLLKGLLSVFDGLVGCCLQFPECSRALLGKGFELASGTFDLAFQFKFQKLYLLSSENIMELTQLVSKFMYSVSGVPPRGTHRGLPTLPPSEENCLKKILANVRAVFFPLSSSHLCPIALGFPPPRPCVAQPPPPPPRPPTWCLFLLVALLSPFLPTLELHQLSLGLPLAHSSYSQIRALLLLFPLPLCLAIPPPPRAEHPLFLSPLPLLSSLLTSQALGDQARPRGSHAVAVPGCSNAPWPSMLGALLHALLQWTGLHGLPHPPLNSRATGTGPAFRSVAPFLLGMRSVSCCNWFPG
ncbi:uncharacterized protein LOC123036236 [Varanus komodoensis]|uniref:uncharacterized protein LOC123036236 n=1 Tax=Varanus komodoensis TaxID=61221 RepID=UPI001CF7846E|nr:uncharacterized protein LOC123036236 [Varanus komodoensis]